MGFELQFDGLSNVFASNPLKDFVVFDEYCKKVLVLRFSEAYDLVSHILKVWLVIIIWQKLGHKCILVERQFKKAFFDILD
jgi:hypothetical protein